MIEKLSKDLWDEFCETIISERLAIIEVEIDRIKEMVKYADTSQAKSNVLLAFYTIDQSASYAVSKIRDYGRVQELLNEMKTWK